MRAGIEQARASLRQIVYELRKALGESGDPFIRAETDVIGLDRSRIGLDIADLARAG